MARCHLAPLTSSRVSLIVGILLFQLLFLLAVRSLSGTACTQRYKPVTHQEQTLFIITPTFARITQKADLSRLSHVLRIAAERHAIHWILVEDAPTKSTLVRDLLQRTGLTYTHLNKKENHIAHHFKGGEPRNEGIRYLRSISASVHSESVVYFADDDNAYDDRLFDEIAKVSSVGVWPVGFSGARRAEFPVVRNGHVVGFEAYLPEMRKFPMDMAGFALNVQHFLKSTPLLFTVNAMRTTGETRLLEGAGIEVRDLEPLAANCTQVLVWHVKSLVPFTEFIKSNDAHIKEV